MGKDQELLEAARSGNVAVVEKILSSRAKRSGPLASLRRGPGANVQDSSGYSALHHAALNGHEQIVEMLLTHEASTNIVDTKGSSPLHLAAWTGNVDIVRLLLCHGPSVPNVNLTTKDNETALHCAAQYGHTEVVTLLLEHSCDPTIRNAKEETALDLAAQYGRLETVELLVRTHPELIHPYSRHGANAEAVFPHTPLHLASRNGHRSVVEILLGAGTSVNLHTRNGTALHEAALCGKLDVVRTLLDAGVDLKARDIKNNTVLDLLKQFPKHATEDIYTTIKRHSMIRRLDDSDSDGNLPPIPVPDLGSPYENIRLVPERGVITPGTSPSRPWGPKTSFSFSKSLSEGKYLKEHRDVDQISVSSVASNTSSISPRIPGDSGAYVPMGSLHSPGSSSSKVSPTPPKKPPRRNLSVSPTHLTPSSPGAYEYLFLARSGDDSVSVSSAGSGRLRRGRSADQYEVMQLRKSFITTPIDVDDSPILQRRKSDHQQQPPVALTYVCDNIQVRTTNPRRKLRRNVLDRDRVYENYDPPQMFVSNAYITLKSSQESLLDEGCRKALTPLNGRNGVYPLSPTHYKQPPTPDHPPPSAQQAETFIHERIRPLSQEYKRRSRDIETETEEELLIYSVALDASSGSLSSSVSLSDKSVSTDNNVEEYFGDAPFAGLMKGSTSQLADLNYKPMPAERPKTLRKLRNVYENVQVDPKTNYGGNDENDASLSILSPFDEQEEWNKISEIMATFNSGLTRDSIASEMEKEIQNRLGATMQKSMEESSKIHSAIGQWLQTFGLGKYESKFLEHGYDDIDFLNGILDAEELKNIGVSEDADIVLKNVEKLPRKIEEISKSGWHSVDKWLDAIHLSIYKETFCKHKYADMDRIRRIWDVELTAVLEISKSGHLKRILDSVGAKHKVAALPEAGLDDINADLDQLKSNIEQLKEEISVKLPTPTSALPPPTTNTGTLRHSHKKSRPAPPPPVMNGNKIISELSIRAPSELLVGVPATLTAQWRHRPEDLVTGSITYIANYLGSTVVKELRGTESTKKSIQKLKKSTSKELTTTPDIVLAISYRGVQFLTANGREPVCEHEIRNIHCACQDADDLTHFAYITKDHISRSHYCHVFCVNSMDQATEVILTLGQAFEVAYQLALREQFNRPQSGNNIGTNTHTRSHSANQIILTNNSNHSRSLSVNEIQINGKASGDQEAKSPSIHQAPLVLNDDL